MGKIIVAIVVGVAVMVGGWFVVTRNKVEQSVKTIAVEPTQVPPRPMVKLSIFTQPVMVNGAMAIEDMEVKTGDVVETGEGGRAQLRFPSGSATRLDGKAKIVLSEFVNEPQQINIRLDAGRIWNRVTKLAVGESFQSQSSTVVATVRGTSYGHGILPDGTNRVTAFKGRVSSICNNSSQAKEVTKNMKTEMNCKPKTSAKTVTLKDAEILADEWLKFNQDQDVILDSEVGADKFDDANEVLGLTTEATPTLEPRPTAVPLIDCVGVDGKTSRVTQEVCDRVNNYWKANPPPANANPNGPAPTQIPTGVPVPTATPTPTLVPLEPIITNLIASPANLDGAAVPPLCGLLLTANIADVGGVKSADAIWQTFDALGLQVFQPTTTQMAVGRTGLWEANLPALSFFLPAGGTFKWSVTAVGTNTTTAVGPDVKEVSTTVACGG